MGSSTRLPRRRQLLTGAESMPKKRCGWVGEGNSLMLEYHDREWGVPVHSDNKHFEFLILEGAASWAQLVDRPEQA
jgi:DNA-3-methyladenine glycosylase I